jgi:hypothetical protein
VRLAGQIGIRDIDLDPEMDALVGVISHYTRERPYLSITTQLNPDRQARDELGQALMAIGKFGFISYHRIDSSIICRSRSGKSNGGQQCRQRTPPGTAAKSTQPHRRQGCRTSA